MFCIVRYAKEALNTGISKINIELKEFFNILGNLLIFMRQLLSLKYVSNKYVAIEPVTGQLSMQTGNA